ncbi:formimidoylglutamate deiminase [Nocardiopsis trehalosi]|jgi:formiminoglutamate deiminase|uniref:formimidoylglutamate deiminase n=1 Tax=Nocardiopsis trehalosi TaxID=109329 RepID=UPI00082D3046|nr:formimidoylglutamate deiminase [Nocardiopsis trehalosi]
MATVDAAGRYWCEWALVDTHPSAAAATPGVLLEVGGGRFTAVGTAPAPPPGAERLPGLTLPGLANAHSHAFHRALRGRTGEHGGSFWTWRERMYAVADRLDPDSYHRLARAVYAEMALAGITCVGEFHYLHHGPGGRPYADPNAMGAALVAAAADAGIRITLLDTLYLRGGLTADGTHAPLSGTTTRFGDADADAWAERVAAFRPGGGHAKVGAAVHSVRAVPRAAVARVADLHRDAGWASLHVHLSEQPAENEACRAAYGRTPTELLDDTGLLAAGPVLVHATHLTGADTALVRSSPAAVCLCPTTERDLADGLPPLAGFEGVAVALGSDGHSTIDMFEEARGAEMHERLRTGRRGTRPSSLLLEGLHGHGHGDALGWTGDGPGGADPAAGWIAPGLRADLLTLDLDGVRLAGFDPDAATDAVVAAATAADVRHVMADGRWIVRDRAHLSVPDAARDLDAAIRELTS